MVDIEPAVVVRGLYKTFKLPHEQHNGIKQAVLNVFNTKRGYESQKVLNDISFEIKKGEFFGIVGRNGSGKSTLLKLLAGIYAPDNGLVQVNGSLTPFIELGVGFNPELTGRENVFMNGALLGFDRKQIESMYEDIVDFAELGKFMDQKLKNYSSGMQVRLAFSIAIRAKSDILLLDEVLAVGDTAFQKKCFNYFMQLKKEKRTVILVTHDMSAVRQYCDRAIMIEKGKIINEGNVEKIAQSYQRLFDGSKSDTDTTADDRWGNGKMNVVDAGIKKLTDTSYCLSTTFKANESLKDTVYGFTVHNSRGLNIFEGNTIRNKVKSDSIEKNQTITVEWVFTDVFATDSYDISVACCDKSATEYFDWLNGAVKFEVSKTGDTAGIVDPQITVSINDMKETGKNS